MKPFALMTSVVVLLSCALFAFEGLPTEQKSPQIRDDIAANNAPLIVHEWGTFTSFSGSDGVNLEFRPLVTNDLPRFVFDRGRQSDASPFSIFRFSKPSIRALQRMETPVTYFYTPVERDVQVQVEFPEGLLTEFYPPVHRLLPAVLAWGQLDNPQQAPELKDSLLDWGTVHLIPTDSFRAHVEDEELSRRIGRYVAEHLVEPTDRKFIHYSAARETDSAIVQVRHDAENAQPNSIVPMADYFEKFLFYRGIGNFSLPLTLSETKSGDFELANKGAQAVRSLFLVSVSGKDVRFRTFEGIEANERLTLEPSETSSTIQALAEEMVVALIGQGLYEKEARAMVKCWQSSWFGEEGTRLLYMVPAATTEKLLPLHVTPTPDETIRVLVGRMEIMPRSTEQRVQQLVKTSAAARAIVKDEERKTFRSPSLTALQEMGRLAEPALVRIRSITEDTTLHTEVDHLITELRRAEDDALASAG